jgi:hypothetical protein
MGKLVITDECLAPAKFIYLNYSGPNPFEVARKIGESLKFFFHVSTAGVSETRLNWDISGDPITFYNTWWVQKKLSGFSTIWVYIKIEGKKSKTTNEGSFMLELRAQLVTKFKYSNPLLKALWWIYSYLFYNKPRRKYVERCNNFATSFRDEIKEHFNLKIAAERGER